MPGKRSWRTVVWSGVVLLSVPLILFLVGWLVVLASRAQLDGQRNVSGLSAAVVIARDSLGIPQIHATNRIDLAYATGFLHAQDRFFQMDLMRRNAAGELAELLGDALLDYDRQMRRHQFRQTARLAWEREPASHQAILEAYAAGVNSGLAALRAKPPEYFVLRQTPRPWTALDSLLVALLMSERLQDSVGYDDRRRELLASVVSSEALQFLDPEGSEWDAALDGSVLKANPIPGPDMLQFRTNSLAAATAESWESPLVPGSNSWGVDGTTSARGGAVVANDMHLDLGLPNIWYRVSARWQEGDRRRQFDGVTLPGTPVFVVGSNGEIAWGFTNATLDSTDVIQLELDPANPRRYRTPEGWRELETVQEEIAVAGAPPHRWEYQRTVWGPVIGTNHLGTLQALRWVAHLPEALNVQLLELERATTADEALRLAPTIGMPMQNILVGDRRGALGWTLTGRMPRREGFDGRLPVSWADGSRRWDGFRQPEDYPVFRGPRLWTANNRISGQSNYLDLGAIHTDLGARARQIRDDLLQLGRTDEIGLFSLYRDDRALFLERWQKLLSKTLERGPSGTNGADWAEMKRQVDQWSGRADTNSVGYRLVRAFRFKAGDLFFEPLVARCREAGSSLPVDSVRWEQPLWASFTERPAHLLNPRFASYDALLSTAVDAVLADLKVQNLTVAEATWGQRNTVRIQHPLSRALPKIASWLDLTPTPLSGDDHMPKIQGVRFGPSERLVVSPGQEEHGILQMPGGQSGHFLSKYYRAGHQAWEEVTPTPLLPGPAEHQLVLMPK